MEDICNFLPRKKHSGDIEYYHFVYEASFRKLQQPFFLSKYRAFLVFKGDGIFKTKDREYKLVPGTLFFTFPKSSFEIEGSSNFTYLYISFNGTGVAPLLDNFGVSEDTCVFEGFEHLTDFWMTSIRRVTPSNATALTESVLLYSLSFIGTQNSAIQETNRFESILSYIKDNFTDPSLSVKKIADIYFYSEKYLSSLFKKNTGVKFTEYLNELRISYAATLMDEKKLSVSEVALRCGFSDPLYFSKVFKKTIGVTPSEYIKKKQMP